MYLKTQISILLGSHTLPLLLVEKHWESLFLQALGLSSEKLWIIRVSILYQLGGSEKRMILNISTEGIYCREVVFPGVGKLNEQKEWRGNITITAGRGFCPWSWVNKGNKWCYWKIEAPRKSCEEPQGTRALTLDVGAPNRCKGL